MAYLERLEEFEERLVKQQKEQTRSILRAIEVTHASIENKLASLPAGRVTRASSLGASQSVRLTQQFGAMRSDRVSKGEFSLRMMPKESVNASLSLCTLAHKLRSRTNSEPTKDVSATRNCGEKAVRFEQTLIPIPSATQTVAPLGKSEQSRTFSLDFDDMEWPPPSNEQDDLPKPSVDDSISPHIPPGVDAALVAASQQHDQGSAEKDVKHLAQGYSRITMRHFDLFMFPIIFLNFIMIFIRVELDGADIASQLGMITDFDTHHKNARLHVFDIFEHAFNAIFVLEIFIRLTVERLAFFRSALNRLDVLIVLWLYFRPYILEQVSSQPFNLSYLRLLRACRVVWTLHVVRTSNMFESLRILMRAIFTSISALMWSLTALVLVIAIASVLISQSLNSFLMNPAENWESQRMVFDLYGSSLRSLYTLFLVTFSDKWQSYVEPLANNVSTVYSFIFSVYVVFVRFGMLHVIAALFVKDTLRVAVHDSHMMLRKKMEKKHKLILLLEEQDTGGIGQFSLDELHAALADPQTKNILLSLGVDIQELDFLFALLQDDDGYVHCHELVDSIMYIQNPEVLAILKHTRPMLQVCKYILGTCRQVEQKMEVSTRQQGSSVSIPQSALPPYVTRSELCPKCQAAEKAKKRKRIMVKLKIFMVLLRQKTTRLGHTLLCYSYQDYLFYRGHLKDEHYGIELCSDHEVWAGMFEFYKNALYALPSAHRFDNVCWIGSSAIPGLVAKPVIDIMITTSEENLKDVVSSICLEAVSEPWMSEHGKGLRFPIGFYMEGWGFLQMPHYQAHASGLLECNVHIFTTGAKAAHDKIILVEYLKSAAGAEFKHKYSILKLSLELRCKNGQLDAANYNKEKNFLVGQILEAAAAWDAVRSPTSAPVSQAAAAAAAEKHGRKRPSFDGKRQQFLL